MAVDAARLRRLLGVPEAEPLLRRLRERLARGQPLTGSVRLGGMSSEETDAVLRLLGRAPAPGERRTAVVSLDALDERLRSAGVCTSLREAVDFLHGPVVDRRALRERSELEWRRVFALARESMSRDGRRDAWLDHLARSGRLKRLSGNDPDRASALVQALARVVARWPAPAMPLAAFAAEVVGDAHGLDPGTELGALAAAAAAAFAGVAVEPTTEGWRAAWAGVGVLCDELSTPALVLNLAPAGNTPLGRILREAAAVAEPVHVSLRSLLRYPLAQDPTFAGLDVHVCENPSIVALAAARLGRRSKPLVCGNGQPATPVQVLLRQLGAAGATLHYHGDFDRGGLAIARWVIERLGARPWRMGAADYAAAAARGRRLEAGRELAARHSPWDPELAAQMEQRGRAVHEELVADALLADLDDR